MKLGHLMTPQRGGQRPLTLVGLARLPAATCGWVWFILGQRHGCHSRPRQGRAPDSTRGGAWPCLQKPLTRGIPERDLVTRSRSRQTCKLALSTREEKLRAARPVPT